RSSLFGDCSCGSGKLLRAWRDDRKRPDCRRRGAASPSPLGTLVFWGSEEGDGQKGGRPPTQFSVLRLFCPYFAFASHLDRGSGAGSIPTYPIFFPGTHTALPLLLQLHLLCIGTGRGSHVRLREAPGRLSARVLVHPASGAVLRLWRAVGDLSWIAVSF